MICKITTKTACSYCQHASTRSLSCIFVLTDAHSVIKVCSSEPSLFSGNAQCLLAGGGVSRALSVLSVLQERQSARTDSAGGTGVLVCPQSEFISAPQNYRPWCSPFFLFVWSDFIFNICQSRGKWTSVSIHNEYTSLKITLGCEGVGGWLFLF